LILISLFIYGCSTDPVILPSLLPETISFLSPQGENGRLYHEITGPTWETPNISIEDTVFILDNRKFDSENYLTTSDLDEPAGYISGSPMEILFNFTTDQNNKTDELPIKLDLKVTLDSQYTDFYSNEILASNSFDLSNITTSGTSIKIITLPLPKVVDVYQLTIEYSLENNKGDKTIYYTKHLIPTTLKAPIPGTPIYHRSMLWASMWAAGYSLPTEEIENNDINNTDYTQIDIEEMEHQISLKMMQGIFTLDQMGYSYGPFPRPTVKDNRAHVFLDFKRTACSEFRGILMALIEYHGIDAKWLSLSFDSPSSTWYSMYETRDIIALGRESQVWRHYNHVIVTVNNKVYDAVYNIFAEDFPTYEDDLFASYCYGEDEECDSPDGWCNYPRPENRPCIENPPGFDESLGMTIQYGDAY
jgi:hypothetical protein